MSIGESMRRRYSNLTDRVEFSGAWGGKLTETAEGSGVHDSWPATRDKVSWASAWWEQIDPAELEFGRGRKGRNVLHEPTSREFQLKKGLPSPGWEETSSIVAFTIVNGRLLLLADPTRSGTRTVTPPAAIVSRRIEPGELAAGHPDTLKIL